MAVQAINGTDKIIYCKCSTRRAEFSVDAFVKAAAKATPPRYDIAAALQPLVDKMKVIYETQQAVLTNKMPID